MERSQQKEEEEDYSAVKSTLLPSVKKNSPLLSQDPFDYLEYYT